MKGKGFKGIAYQCKYVNLDRPNAFSFKYSQRWRYAFSSKLYDILSRVLFNYTEQGREVKVQKWSVTSIRWTTQLLHPVVTEILCGK